MRRAAPAATAVLLAAACASVPPSGPSVMVLPGSQKSFEQFRADDLECRQFAADQTGGSTPADAQVDSGLKSAAVGTAVGAAAGALIGGRDGAALGAGTGLIVGSSAGAGAAQGSTRALQGRYDAGYVQCMYAKGHKVPVSGRYEHRRRTAAAPPPPPPPPR